MDINEEYISKVYYKLVGEIKFFPYKVQAQYEHLVYGGVVYHTRDSLEKTIWCDLNSVYGMNDVEVLTTLGFITDHLEELYVKGYKQS